MLLQGLDHRPGTIKLAPRRPGREIAHCGHLLSNVTLSPSSDSLPAIQQLPVPDELRGLCGGGRCRHPKPLRPSLTEVERERPELGSGTFVPQAFLTSEEKNEFKRCCKCCRLKLEKGHCKCQLVRFTLPRMENAQNLRGPNRPFCAGTCLPEICDRGNPITKL